MVVDGVSAREPNQELSKMQPVAFLSYDRGNHDCVTGGIQYLEYPNITLSRTLQENVLRAGENYIGEDQTDVLATVM